MTRRFVMDFGPGAGAEPDQFEFELRGVTRQGGEWSEVFTALPAIPVGVLANLGDGLLNAAKCIAFVVAVLVPEDEDRFLELTLDKDRLVDSVELAGLASRLLMEVTGRPTTPSVRSSAGAPNTGTTSTDGSSSPVLALATSTDGNS